jgi:hypothetical protein
LKTLLAEAAEVCSIGSSLVQVCRFSAFSGLTESGRYCAE